MFEKEAKGLQGRYWTTRYVALDEEIERRATREESEMFFSFGLILSGFGGSVSARKYLSGKMAENA